MTKKAFCLNYLRNYELFQPNTPLSLVILDMNMIKYTNFIYDIIIFTY